MALKEQDKTIDLSYPVEVLQAMGREELIDHKVAVRLGEWKSVGGIVMLAKEKEVQQYRERFAKQYATLRATIETELIACNAIRPVAQDSTTEFVPAQSDTFAA